MHAVVFVARDSDNQEVYALGSGVFVAAGWILTKKHVIDEAWPQLGRHTKRRFDSIAPFQIDAYHWPSQDGRVAIWRVDAVWDISFSDMALARVRPSNDVAQTNHPGTVAVMNVYPPAVGETVIAVGFPKTGLKHDRHELELPLHPSVATGLVNCVYEAYRDKGFPCFEVSTHVFGGMSGGPVYNEASELCGIVCASIEGYPVFYALSLWPVIFIQLTHDENHKPLNPAPYFGELGRSFLPIRNLEEAIARHHVINDADTGRQRLILRPVEERKKNGSDVKQTDMPQQ
jgi:hypothetical protein